MRVPAIVIVIGGIFTAAVMCALAGATPPLSGPPAPGPAGSRDRAPLVGRVRFVDRTVDLTRASLSATGAARELREATARAVQADVDPSLTRQEHRASDREYDRGPTEGVDRFAR
jgi:hypothetical protein